MLKSYILNRYFKRKLDIICEWIPQLLFLLAVIGYLCVLILVKWFTWTVADAQVSKFAVSSQSFVFKSPGRYQAVSSSH